MATANESPSPELVDGAKRWLLSRPIAAMFLKIAGLSQTHPLQGVLFDELKIHWIHYNSTTIFGWNVPDGIAINVRALEPHSKCSFTDPIALGIRLGHEFQHYLIRKTHNDLNVSSPEQENVRTVAQQLASQCYIPKEIREAGLLWEISVIGEKYVFPETEYSHVLLGHLKEYSQVTLSRSLPASFLAHSCVSLIRTCHFVPTGKSV